MIRPTTQVDMQRRDSNKSVALKIRSRFHKQFASTIFCHVCSCWLTLWPVAGGRGEVWAGWPSLSRVGSRGVGGVSWHFGTSTSATAPTRCREIRYPARPRRNGILPLGAARLLKRALLPPVNIAITGCARAAESPKEWSLMVSRDDESSSSVACVFVTRES